MSGHCCELSAHGWGVHPDVAENIGTAAHGREILSVLRDFWRMACEDDRRHLLPTVRRIEQAIEELS
jgi:hypothetical protein